MSSGPGSFSRHNHLEELNDPLETATGWLSATSRRAKALAALAGTAMTAAQLAFTAGVTAGTAAASKALVLDANSQVGQFVNSLGFIKQATPAAKTTSTTLTAAELLGRLITGNQGAAGAATYTLPLASDLDTAVAALVALQNDLAFDFALINISTVAAEDITVATNTGWTLVGEMVVPSNDTAGVAPSNALFRARRTGSNAWSLYRIG